MIEIIKKAIFGMLLLGIAIWAMEASAPLDEASFLIADGETIKIAYTDENSGEDLIIKTDKQKYVNWAGKITVYFTVLNNSKRSQNVKVAFSFKDLAGNEKFVKKIEEYIGDKEEIITEIVPTIVSTTTIKSATTGEEIIIAQWGTTTIEKRVKVWKELAIYDFNAEEVNIQKRKDIKGAFTLKNSSFYLKRGEMKFLKAEIAYLMNEEEEEFFIEAFGDKGSYGHLDPWVYEQTFNNLNDGDLNGQDSWSGDTDFDVQSTVAYEGAKSVKCIPTYAIDKTISRTVDSVSAGTVYISIRQSDVTAGNRMWFEIYEGTTRLVLIRTNWNDDQYLNYRQGTTVKDLTAISNDTWYRVGIEFDCSTDQFRVNVDNGTWSAWGNFDSNNTCSTGADKIQFLCEEAVSGQTYDPYWDFISPNYEVTAAARRIIIIN